MAHFRGTVAGNRGEASRLGSKDSGLFVRANGWNVGVAVSGAAHNDGKDRFDVYATSGSNGGGSALIGTVQLGKWTGTPAQPGKPEFIPSPEVREQIEAEYRERIATKREG